MIILGNEAGNMAALHNERVIIITFTFQGQRPGDVCWGEDSSELLYLLSATFN